MAENDPGDVESRLELPSFGFGRKKRNRVEGSAAAPVAAQDPVAEPEPVREPVAEPEPVADVAPEPEPVTRDAVPPDVPRAPAPPREPEESVRPARPFKAPKPAKAPKPPREPRELSLPALAPLQAAIVTGAVVGLLAVGLNFAALAACDLIRGTTSCGGPGVLLLVAILILITYIGGWLLRGFHVQDAGSTAFLAVGLLTVVVMLFLVEALFSAWMVVVIPLLSVAAFVASWKLTTSFADVDVE